MAEKKKSAPVSAGPVKPEDKKKALETALAQIEKNFGKGAIMRLGDDIPVNVEAISTGSLSLDLALGIGGVPRGRIVEIYGPESSGKTTLALHILASAQKTGGEVAFIDVEHALEPAYARALGVDIDSLLISQPDTGEQALEITEQLVRSGALDVVVVDSVAALLPRSELEGEMGESSVGVIARLMSQALRKLAGTVSRTNCIVVFINQLREKIGVMYGNPETTPGGRALKYFSSVRIDVRRIETLKVGGEMIGNRTRAMSVKELTDRLKEKGETPDNAEDAAAWLEQMHLLDDAQYAAMCVRHYAAKGYGAGRIRSELYRRGIPREAWDDAMQELPEQDEQIDALLRRRLRSDTPDRDELRRASDYLYRRGFGRDEIRAAIARYQDNFEEY